MNFDQHNISPISFVTEEIIKKWKFVTTNQELENHIKIHFDKYIQIKSIFIKGSIINRIIILVFSPNHYFSNSNNKCKKSKFNSIVFSLNKTPLDIYFKKTILKELDLVDPLNWISYTFLDQQIIYKLSRPKIAMVCLYKLENFPAPRFALGIADIASTLRQQMLGQVKLFDMQLKISLDDIIQNLIDVDIIGISCTFGQHDLLLNLIKKIKTNIKNNPLLIVGGSLAALNYKYLLELDKNLFVCRGYGEYTMNQIAKYWHNIISIEQIPDICYFDKKTNKIIQTPKTKTTIPILGIPELDLLPETFKNKGVMILESSRGCNSACSFCPRKHKGTWTGDININHILKLMPFIAKEMENYNISSKTIFYVDEEFVGANNNLGLSYFQNKIKYIYENLGFSFESSSRIDQVYNPNKSKDYNIERWKIWKKLSQNGLRRCLFGVESGVDTILKRFNKRTTMLQNLYGIRVLTSLSVSVRLTYITFDPMMNIKELVQSFIFQGRKDAILKATNLDLELLYDKIADEEFCRSNTTYKPIFTYIPYMLVSLEGLFGSFYLKKAQKLGLTSGEKVNLAMGRSNIKYLDTTIGLFSYISQLWINKNFPLDYRLKGILKLYDGIVNYLIKNLRNIIKTYSYTLLAKMISLYFQNFEYTSNWLSNNDQYILQKLFKYWSKSDKLDHKKNILLELINHHIEDLQTNFLKLFTEYKSKLSASIIFSIEEEVKKWMQNKAKWCFINP